jgi:hypothetical protein
MIVADHNKYQCPGPDVKSNPNESTLIKCRRLQPFLFGIGFADNFLSPEKDSDDYLNN